MILTKRFSPFFKDHPSLLPSLFFLLGLGFSIQASLALCLPFIALSLPLLFQPKRLFVLYLLFLIAFFYGKHTNEKFPQELSSFTGTAVFSLSEIKIQQSHLKKIPSLQGTIISMEGPLGERAYNIPCRFTIPSSSFVFLQSNTYEIEGTLEKKENYFAFTPAKDVPWKEKKGGFCFAKWRFNIKNALKKGIERRYPNSMVSDFIVALTLGDLDNRLLRFSFSKLGLQHILAISGFHFSLLSLFIGCFLRFFLKEKTAILILLALLTCYFLLLHEAASIVRAYFAIALYLIGRLFDLRPKALNLLGITLFIELLLFPQSIKNLGFQLSFLATASILLLYSSSFNLITKLLPQRNNTQALSLHPVEKILYLLSSFLRSTFAVNLAVSLTIVPTCLWYFKTFPLVSLIYNLFVPFTVFITMLLFLLALPLKIFLPPLGAAFDYLNERFTAKILELLIESPNCLNITINIPFTSQLLLYVYILLLFSFSILEKTKKKSAETI